MSTEFQTKYFHMENYWEASTYSCEFILHIGFAMYPGQSHVWEYGSKLQSQTFASFLVFIYTFSHLSIADFQLTWNLIWLGNQLASSEVFPDLGVGDVGEYEPWESYYTEKQSKEN